jgi:hypothetical protein
MLHLGIAGMHSADLTIFFNAAEQKVIKIKKITFYKYFMARMAYHFKFVYCCTQINYSWLHSFTSVEIIQNITSIEKKRALRMK